VIHDSISPSTDLHPPNQARPMTDMSTVLFSTAYTP
jgi:hypothetical protein